MLLFENKQRKLLNILKLTGSPFKKFVSTGEIKEDLGVTQSRQELLYKIIDIMEKNDNIILPIIGKVGTGKTHLYWALKHGFHNYNIVYLSLENVYKRFYYNTYSEFVENMGVGPLRNITNNLCNKWGATERKFGFFHFADIKKIRDSAYKEWNSYFEDKEALNDAINAITAHCLDPYKKVEAERWLLGDLMDFRDLSRLNLNYDLRKKNNAFTMLKILTENAKINSILFIDDFEKVISIAGPIKEAEEEEEVFDPSWLYGAKTSPDKITAEKTLDKILELYKIKGLRIIITLKSLEFFNEIKSKIKEKNGSLLSIVKEPIFLSNFLIDDIFQFYKKSIEYFFGGINYLDYSIDFPNSSDYYPLNKKTLEYIYNTTKGNPREIIKLLIKIFNEIISSNENIEDILKKYQ